MRKLIGLVLSVLFLVLAPGASAIVPRGETQPSVAIKMPQTVARDDRFKFTVQVYNGMPAAAQFSTVVTIHHLQSWKYARLTDISPDSHFIATNENRWIESNFWEGTLQPGQTAWLTFSMASGSRSGTFPLVKFTVISPMLFWQNGVVTRKRSIHVV